MKTFIGRLLKKFFGIRIQKIKPVTGAVERNVQNLLFEQDDYFNSTYDLGIKMTGTPFDDLTKYFTKRRIRFYNTIQFFLLSNSLDGYVAECGCYKGLSSFIMCNYAKRKNSNYKGSDYIIIDSFEGLSDPSKEDALSIDEGGNEKYFVAGGYFSTPMDEVKSALIEFPEITYVKGWIPETLSNLPDKKFRFVHIDLDLYSPIKGALEYFYPKLVPGGLIVVDDYGSLYWPGAKKSVEEFCEENNIHFLNISSAQAIIWKK